MQAGVLCVELYQSLDSVRGTFAMGETHLVLWCTEVFADFPQIDLDVASVAIVSNQTSGDFQFDCGRGLLYPCVECLYAAACDAVRVASYFGQKQFVCRDEVFAEIYRFEIT